jgi:hypothetical protein
VSIDYPVWTIKIIKKKSIRKFFSISLHVDKHSFKMSLNMNNNECLYIHTYDRWIDVVNKKKAETKHVCAFKHITIVREEIFLPNTWTGLTMR